MAQQTPLVTNLICIDELAHTLDKNAKMVNNKHAGASPNTTAKSLLELDFIPCLAI